jgi:hypothetical protein
MSEPKKLGRPTLYKPEYAEKVRKVCLLGGTDAQIADFFGVDESTINNWKIAHPEFLESIRETKVLQDIEAADSLRHQVKCGNVQAIMFWLKNRQPRSWRDQQNIDAKLSIEVERPDLSALTDEELALYESLNAKTLPRRAPKQIDSSK